MAPSDQRRMIISATAARAYRRNVNATGGMTAIASLTTMKLPAHTTITPRTRASITRRSVVSTRRPVGVSDTPAEPAADAAAVLVADRPTPAGRSAGVMG